MFEGDAEAKVKYCKPEPGSPRWAAQLASVKATLASIAGDIDRTESELIGLLGAAEGKCDDAIRYAVNNLDHAQREIRRTLSNLNAKGGASHV